MRKILLLIALAAALCLAGSPAWAAGDKPEPSEPAAAPVPPEPREEFEKPRPLDALTFSLDYTLVTDYVWRGVNLSEYDTEGREDLNHQFTLAFEIDPDKLVQTDCEMGRFGASIWFQWYAGLDDAWGWQSGHLEEVDYSVYWAYDNIADSGLGVELGWIAYHFPAYRDGDSPVSGDLAYTHEAYVTLRYDDSKLFGCPILSPEVSYFQDVDDVRGGILSGTVSHGFRMGDWLDGPLSYLTVTPSLTMVVDHRYYDQSGFGSRSGAETDVGTRLAYLEYGLNFAYDLSGALNIPPQYGALTVGAFLNFVQAFHDVSPDVNDQLYGGMNVGWTW